MRKLSIMLWQVSVAFGVVFEQLPGQSIPVLEVTRPVVSSERFAARPSVRALGGGKLLVDDKDKKRLIVFDSLMTLSAVTADSNGTAARYPTGTGLFSFPLIPYIGDSTLWVDFAAKSFLVIDPNGIVIRASAHPKTDDLLNLIMGNSNTPGVDPDGRLFYRASGSMHREPKSGELPIVSNRDTLWIVRADFERRVVDTVGTYTVPRNPSTVQGVVVNGKRTATLKVNPLPAAADAWAVLSNGTIGVVREHDYHVDWIAPDGRRFASDKLPFAWKPLSDADKLARVDSVKRVIDSLANAGTPYGRGFESRANPDGGRMLRDTIIPVISYAPLNEMRDFVPPIQPGSVSADADGNLWVLPTTSGQAGAGLLYDVISPQKQLFQRVRVPVGFAVIAHGRHGVVYLARYDASKEKKWVLARCRIIQ